MPQGYADKLKEQGMVKTNLQGEDISKVRRQQFEVSPHCKFSSRQHVQRVDSCICVPYNGVKTRLPAEQGTIRRVIKRAAFPAVRTLLLTTGSKPILKDVRGRFRLALFEMGN